MIDSEIHPADQDLKFRLHRKLLERINMEVLAGVDDGSMRGEVREELLGLVHEEPNLLTAAEKQRITEEVLDEVFGLGPLQALLQDPAISDILVNGHKQVYVERHGLLEPTTVRFRDDGHLLRIIDRIVSQVGRRVDESNPDGGRPPAGRLARQRDHSAAGRRWTPALHPPLRQRQADAGRSGDASLRSLAGMMRLLEAAVRARLNIVVSGGTGAGKTTLLNVLSAFISPTGSAL